MDTPNFSWIGAVQVGGRWIGAIQPDESTTQDTPELYITELRQMAQLLSQ